MNYYRGGDWKATCEVCGLWYKASQLRLRWDGLRVCRMDFEHRHPQEFLRSVPDEVPPHWTAPEGAHPETMVCTYRGTQAIAGVGVAGCMIAGRADYSVLDVD